MESSALRACERALSLFHDDKLGSCLRSPIFDLELRYRFAMPSDAQAVQDAIRNINHDIWAVGTICSRLEWMRSLALSRQLDAGAWRVYAQVDIEALLVQMRSVLDYSTAIVTGFAPKSGQLPSSFRVLVQRPKDYASRLPAGVADLLHDAGWFFALREVRDASVHEGANTIVFAGPEDGVLFQIYSYEKGSMLRMPVLMFNENVVRLERFVAWQFSEIISFLDSLGRLFIESAPAAPFAGPVSTYSDGFPILRKWIQSLEHDLRVHLTTH